MKYTGYALIAIGLVLAFFTVAYSLIDFDALEWRIGRARGNGYWYALVPAFAAAAVGVWFLRSRHAGFSETYDTTRQQS